jgi:hypothetical protein
MTLQFQHDLFSELLLKLLQRLIALGGGPVIRCLLMSDRQARKNPLRNGTHDEHD